MNFSNYINIMLIKKKNTTFVLHAGKDIIQYNNDLSQYLAIINLQSQTEI